MDFQGRRRYSACSERRSPQGDSRGERLRGADAGLGTHGTGGNTPGLSDGELDSGAPRCWICKRHHRFSGERGDGIASLGVPGMGKKKCWPPMRLLSRGNELTDEILFPRSYLLDVCKHLSCDGYQVHVLVCLLYSNHNS